MPLSILGLVVRRGHLGRPVRGGSTVGGSENVSAPPARLGRQPPCQMWSWVGDSLSACKSSAGDRPHQDTEPKPAPEPAGVVIALQNRHPGNPQAPSLRRLPMPLSPPLTSRPSPCDTPSPLSFQRLRDAPSFPARCCAALLHPLHTTTRSPLPFQPVSQWEYAGSLRHDQLTNGSERDGPATNFWPMGALAGGKGAWTRLS